MDDSMAKAREEAFRQWQKVKKLLDQGSSSGK